MSTRSTPLRKLAIRAWIALCGLYFLWEGATYRGFFARLAEWQIGHFGAYAPLLTFLFLFLLAVFPAWLILRILRKRDPEPEVEPTLEVQIKRAKTLRAIFYSFAVVAFGVILGFIAYILFALPGTDGRPQTIAASDAGSVAIVEGPARLVGGELGTIVFFGQDWYIADDRMAFSPYRPAGSGAATFFVQLEAKSRKRLAETTQRPSWSGILVEGGLPGPIRVLFNALGVGISDPYYTLYRDEYSLKVRYWLQVIQWTILSIFLLLFGVLQSRRVKRLEKEAEEAKETVG
ncbi:hypothetical protein GCM10009115_05810 [Sphingopyxis soli]|jgi:hypothetical protein|uniref:Cytochrome c-type biogenesis protein CcmF C-terminal domain-containing protein n=1 Tax=Sphingopyxis soli TaxID=592051 RepID=A0ABN1LXY5_9SPHN|nr:hypothetical protein [Sphingopyxis soli]